VTTDRVACAALVGRALATHLSGPNGMGRSAVLLLASLIFVPRDIPVAFITRTTGWEECWKQPVRSAMPGDSLTIECRPHRRGGSSACCFRGHAHE
jgi:hypothetical protein